MFVLGGRVSLGLRPSLSVETTALPLILRCLTRVLLISGSAVMTMTLESLLYADFAKAWALEIRSYISLLLKTPVPRASERLVRSLKLMIIHSDRAVLAIDRMLFRFRGVVA
jgi:hypothetical protein